MLQTEIEVLLKRTGAFKEALTHKGPRYVLIRVLMALGLTGPQLIILQKAGIGRCSATHSGNERE